MKLMGESFNCILILFYFLNLDYVSDMLKYKDIIGVFGNFYRTVQQS